LFNGGDRGFIVTDHFGGWTDGDLSLFFMAAKLFFDLPLIPDQGNADRKFQGSENRSFDYFNWGVVSPHGVEGDPDHSLDPDLSFLLFFSLILRTCFPL
jgi:hypothetical protein